MSIVGLALIILYFLIFIILVYNMDIFFDNIGAFSVLLGFASFGIFLGIGLTAKQAKDNDWCKAKVETVAETEKEEISNSAKNSNIKIALIQNYPEAEIISNEDDLQRGIFIYNNETYNFEVEDNILFIKQDKKLVKYIYLN